MIELAVKQLAATEKQNEFLEKQNALMGRILSRLSTPQSGLVNHLPDLPREDLPENVIKVPLPSKDELAHEWLEQHPEDRELTGRDLEKLRKPMDVKISYVTWNKAKKGFSE